MTHSYFSNDDQVTLINLSNGNRVTVYKDDKRFQKFKDLIIAGDYDSAEKMDAKSAIQNFTARFVGNQSFNITIADGNGEVNVKGTTYPLSDVIVKRIIKMVGEGFDAQPLVNFMCNLYDNPSKAAVDELFLFMDQSELPITQDGFLIAYKIVKNDYTDIYSGKFDNSVGKVVEMPRFAVDDNRSNTCSAGLHFCSKGYLNHYGSEARNNDRCMLVKINPKDIVSIPNDYNNAKGRTCRYEVIGEVTTDEWREFLADRDYNNTSVVSNDGSDIKTGLSWSDLTDAGYYFDANEDVFRSKFNDKFVPRSWVANKLGVMVSTLEALVYGDGDNSEVAFGDMYDYTNELWDRLEVQGYNYDYHVGNWRDGNGHYVSIWSVSGNTGISVDDLKQLVA
jgi:hypothetical protein